jgi:catalase
VRPWPSRGDQADQKRQLFDNIAAAMAGVPEAIQLRQIGHFTKADPAYGQGVAERLGLIDASGRGIAA